MKAFARQDPHAGKAGPTEGQTSPQLAAQVGSYELGSCPADPHGGMGKVCDLGASGELLEAMRGSDRVAFPHSCHPFIRSRVY